MTITDEQRKAIAAYVNTHEIPAGLGTKEAACSIAAINLALTGKLTDKIPDCMSPVIGKWIIGVQDAMPHAMRNSKEWKQLLPLAAGTGREFELERLEIIMDWMWTKVLPSLQPLADQHGFGEAWKALTTEKKASAEEAEEAAAAAAWAARAARAAAAWAARAARAAEAAEAAEAWAARAAEEAAVAAAEAAAEAAEWAAEWAAPWAAAEKWELFSPADLLAKLIAVGTEWGE